MNKIIFKKLVNVITLLSFFLWNLAIAAPQGGQVVAGGASISQAGTTTTINQSSQSAVINWNSFNTASNEAVNFVQPNSSAIALNRIMSGQPTNFAGSLSANGQVWILNPNGVVFTGTSNINVAGLLATTSDISNSDFMSGNYNFSTPGNPTASIINNGNIVITNAGIAALVGSNVTNNGVIQANLGKVALASGTAFVLDLNGDGLINFGNSAPVQNGYVSNAGKIIANGGKVFLTANSAAQAVDSVINMSGVIEAHSVGASHGVIILNGGHHGKVKVSGKLDTSNMVAGAKGGFIETSGDALDISSTAIINPGVGGTWSVDPNTLYVIPGPNCINPSSCSDNFTAQPGDSAIGADFISNELFNGVNVQLNGDTINVWAAIDQGLGAAFAVLSMYATTALNITQGITITNGDLYLQSGGVLSTLTTAPLSVTNGYMDLIAATLLETDGALNITNGSLYIFNDTYGSGDDIYVNGAVTALNSDVEILSGYQNVIVNGAINATNAESIEIYGAQNVTINAPITTNNAYLDVRAGYCWDGCDFGDLTINSGGVINATDNSVYLSASNSVEIGAPITILGESGGDLDVYAYGWDFGVITVDSGAPINVTNGDVYFWSYNDVELNDAITVNNGGFEAVGVFGDVDVYAPIQTDNYMDLFAYYDVYVDDGVALTVNDGGLDIIGGYCYWGCSNSGTVTTNGPISVTNGDAYIFAPDSVTTNDTIDVTNGGLELQTTYYSIHMNGEVTATGSNNAYFEAYAGGSVHIDAPVSVTNTDGYFDGDYAVDIEAGNEYSWGKDYINYPITLDGGDMYLYARNNIYINDMITVTNGGLEISTGGGSGDIFIEAPITVDNYLDIYPDNNLYLDEAVTVNFGGLEIEAGSDVYLNAPIIANDDSYIYGSTIFVNAGITVNDGTLEFETGFSSGPIYINTTDPIISDYTQYYDDAVILGTDGGTVTLTSNFGNVKFYSTVDSGWWLDVPASLLINVPNGYVKFTQNVGDWYPLNNLMVNGATKFWNWCNSLDVITFLSQIYNGPVTSNTDMLLLTIFNGGIFLNSGYSAPDNYLTLITGADSDFIGGGSFGDSINVFGLVFGGTGSADLTNTIVNGFGGADAFGQVVLDGATGDHYCVNGVGIGSCIKVMVLPSTDEVIHAQLYTQPSLPNNAGGWVMNITDANGNSIESCTDKGCVISVVK